MSNDNRPYPACLEREDLEGRRRTRTPETESAYRKRYRSLRKRAAKLLGPDGSPQDTQDAHDAQDAQDTHVAVVAHWLANAASNLSHSAYRQYRAAIHQEMRDLWDATAIPLAEVELIAASMLLSADKDGRSPYAPRRPFHTSAGRAKAIGQAKAASLAARASACKRRAGQDLADFLTLGPKLGLRLSEWPGAALDGATLTIPCGKYSKENARGIAPHRTQILHWENSELVRLDGFLKRLHAAVRATDGRGDLVMRCMGHLLRNIRKDANAPRLTLKTMRHQYTANLRAAGYSRNETAAALGHASADTSEQHYGKKNRGWRGLRRWIDIPKQLTDQVRPGAKTTAKLKRQSESIAQQSQLRM
jgi:integrase